MKFVPKAPTEGINVSQEHPLKEASILTFGLAAIFALAAAVLFFFVDLVITLVPAETEARVLSSWIPADLELLSDGKRLTDVEDLLGRLASHWPQAPYTFRAGILREDEPNALALPGGLILITTGLLEGVESENELAFVLGHELGHFRHRDHLRQLGRGVALGLLLSVVSGSDAGIGLGNAVTDLTARGFSRRQERRADRFGLEILAAEYGHVADSGRFFERLGENLDLGRAVAYFSTHPATAERLDDLRRYATERGWPLEGSTVQWRPADLAE